MSYEHEPASLFRGTTICAVKRDGVIAIAGDGQVTMGEKTIMKATAKKVRRIFGGRTVLGALARHVCTPNPNFQPMNANFGILEPLPFKVKGKRNRYEKLSEVAIETLNEVIKTYEL